MYLQAPDYCTQHFVWQFALFHRAWNSISRSIPISRLKVIVARVIRILLASVRSKTFFVLILGRKSATSQSGKNAPIHIGVHRICTCRWIIYKSNVSTSRILSRRRRPGRTIIFDAINWKRWFTKSKLRNGAQKAPLVMLPIKLQPTTLVLSTFTTIFFSWNYVFVCSRHSENSKFPRRAT